MKGHVMAAKGKGKGNGTKGNTKGNTKVKKEFEKHERVDVMAAKGKGKSKPIKPLHLSGSGSRGPDPHQASVLGHFDSAEASNIPVLMESFQHPTPAAASQPQLPPYATSGQPARAATWASQHDPQKVIASIILEAAAVARDAAAIAAERAVINVMAAAYSMEAEFG